MDKNIYESLLKEFFRVRAFAIGSVNVHQWGGERLITVGFID
jgi:hypothetical protein